MQALDVVQRLAATSSRSAREAIIYDAHVKNCNSFFGIIQLAFDPFITFGVKKVAEILEDDGQSGSFTFSDFQELCNKLQSRTLVDEAARLAIHAAAAQCDVQTWNQLYRRVLLKDLALDIVAYDTVCKRVKSPDARRIPQFRCQQAKATITAPITGHRLVDVKLKGERLLAILDRLPRLHLMDGLAVSYPDLETALRPLTERLPAPLVVDGVRVPSGEYVIFDIVPLEGFKNHACEKTQSRRRAVLESLQRSGVFSALVRVLPQVEIAFDQDRVSSSYRDFLQQAKEHGYTDIMIKQPDARYTGKRTDAWISRKIEL